MQPWHALTIYPKHQHLAARELNAQGSENLHAQSTQKEPPMAISKPRNRVVLFRLTQEEFSEVQQACENGAARSVSDYARARILGVGDAPSLASWNTRSWISRALSRT